MRKILELAIQHARGPTAGVVTPKGLGGQGVVEGPSGFSSARKAGNSTTPPTKPNGASSWRGGAVGPIKGGAPLAAATSTGGKPLSAGTTGGGMRRRSKIGGLDKAGNDNTPGKMIRTQKAVRVRLGKVMD